MATFVQPIRPIPLFSTTTIFPSSAPNIAIRNNSTVITDKMAETALRAIQKQVVIDLFRAWDKSARLYFFPKAATIPTISPSGSPYWTVTLLNNTDQPPAAGYHWFRPAPTFTPAAKVFVNTSGSSWPMVASHEILEMIVDPYLNFATIFPSAVPTSVSGIAPKNFVSSLFLTEICDPVPSDPYPIDGILVSNFVTPAWYQLFRFGRGGTFDRKGTLKNPTDLGTGGYFPLATISPPTQFNSIS